MTAAEVISSILQQLDRNKPTEALNLYEEAFRPHIYHQLERGKSGTTAVMGLEQWRLPVELTRQLLRAAKDTARYSLAQEFYTLLMHAEAITPHDAGTMMSVYAITGQTKEGEALFDELITRSPDSPNYIKPNVYHYNAMLKLYRVSNQPVKARKLWEEMISPSSEMKPIASSYAAALSAGIIKNEEFSPMLDLFISSVKPDKSPLLSAISFSSFMAAVPTNLIKSLEPRLTQARKLIPNIQMSNYVAILSAYAHAGMRRQTEEIEEEMLQARLVQSPSTVTVLLALYTRLHLVDHQKRFMNKLKGKKVDLHGMTTIMNALTNQGLSGSALNFFREFQKDNVFVDMVAYNAAMHAAAMASNPTQVLDLMQEAKDRGLTLDTSSYGMLQMAYAKTKDLKGVRDAMVKMKLELGVDPDARSWTAYLNLLTRLHAPAHMIESGIHSMIGCGYAPHKETLMKLIRHLERLGEVVVIARIESLAKSGALGPDASKHISQTRTEMPIGPLLKQAFSQSHDSHTSSESL
jgi:pentatricopeptide repeat protein